MKDTRPLPCWNAPRSFMQETGQPFETPCVRKDFASIENILMPVRTVEGYEIDAIFTPMTA